VLEHVHQPVQEHLNRTDVREAQGAARSKSANSTRGPHARGRLPLAKRPAGHRALRRAPACCIWKRDASPRRSNACVPAAPARLGLPWRGAGLLGV
jgi:hypothetical protein